MHDVIVTRVTENVTPGNADGIPPAGRFIGGWRGAGCPGRLLHWPVPVQAVAPGYRAHGFGAGSGMARVLLPHCFGATPMVRVLLPFRRCAWHGSCFRFGDARDASRVLELGAGEYPQVGRG